MVEIIQVRILGKISFINVVISHSMLSKLIKLQDKRITPDEYSFVRIFLYLFSTPCKTRRRGPRPTLSELC